MIVDSFVDKESDMPIALKYLNDNGINPEKDVQYIVITHWHSDHIGGMSEVISACRNATVVIPSVFTKNEFVHFITLVAKDPSAGSLNPTKEMHKAFTSIKQHCSGLRSTFDLCFLHT